MFIYDLNGCVIESRWNLITGGKNIYNMKSVKEIAIQIVKEAGLFLHKWHSNGKKLEETD